MSIENIGVRPAENGFTVNISERGEGKKGEYKERSMIAKDASEVAALVEKACGKAGRGRGRGMSLTSSPVAQTSGRSGNARKSSRKKSGKGKR